MSVGRTDRSGARGATHRGVRPGTRHSSDCATSTCRAGGRQAPRSCRPTRKPSAGLSGLDGLLSCHDSTAPAFAQARMKSTLLGLHGRSPPKKKGEENGDARQLRTRRNRALRDARRAVVVVGLVEKDSLSSTAECEQVNKQGSRASAVNRGEKSARRNERRTNVVVDRARHVEVVERMDPHRVVRLDVQNGRPARTKGVSEHGSRKSESEGSSSRPSPVDTDDPVLLKAIRARFCVGDVVPAAQSPSSKREVRKRPGGDRAERSEERGKEEGGAHHFSTRSALADEASARTARAERPARMVRSLAVQQRVRGSRREGGGGGGQGARNLQQALLVRLPATHLWISRLLPWFFPRVHPPDRGCGVRRRAARGTRASQRLSRDGPSRGSGCAVRLAPQLLLLLRSPVRGAPLYEREASFPLGARASKFLRGLAPPSRSRRASRTGLNQETRSKRGTARAHRCAFASDASHGSENDQRAEYSPLARVLESLPSSFGRRGACSAKVERRWASSRDHRPGTDGRRREGASCASYASCAESRRSIPERTASD